MRLRIPDCLLASLTVIAFLLVVPTQGYSSSPEFDWAHSCQAPDHEHLGQDELTLGAGRKAARRFRLRPGPHGAADLLPAQRPHVQPDVVDTIKARIPDSDVLPQQMHANGNGNKNFQYETDGQATRWFTEWAHLTSTPAISALTGRSASASPILLTFSSSPTFSGLGCVRYVVPSDDRGFHLPYLQQSAPCSCSTYRSHSSGNASSFRICILAMLLLSPFAGDASPGSPLARKSSQTALENHHVMLRVVRVTPDWMPFASTDGWTQAVSVKESDVLKYYEAAIWEETPSVHLLHSPIVTMPGMDSGEASLMSRRSPTGSNSLFANTRTCRRRGLKTGASS